MRVASRLLVAATLAALPALAQQPAPAPKQAAPAPKPAAAPVERGSPAAVAAFRDAVKADKRAVVAKNMELTEAEAKKFWPLYDAYQKDLDKLLQRQNRAIVDYVNQASSMSDANAKRIARELLDADAEEQRLRERQLKKLYAILPARKAIRYLQIENKIRTLNHYDMGAQIPLVQ
jgi:Spy/CpxP family protein refolding chaperone